MIRCLKIRKNLEFHGIRVIRYNKEILLAQCKGESSEKNLLK